MTLSARRIPLPLIVILIFPLLWLLWLGMYVISPGPTADEERLEVLIPSRTSLSAIEQLLAAKGVIHDDPRFSILAKLTGAAPRLRAGEYAFAPGTKPLKIIRQLQEGKVLYRPVTIPEGTELAGIGEILSAGGWVDRDRFLALTEALHVLSSNVAVKIWSRQFFRISEPARTHVGTVVVERQKPISFELIEHGQGPGAQVLHERLQPLRFQTHVKHELLKTA